ncbi:MAG TPA: hypothetical protein VM754_00040 [Actinomycetota bacterium]|nr:hypothetical protein [Actinomycetota bacterium]
MALGTGERVQLSAGGDQSRVLGLDLLCVDIPYAARRQNNNCYRRNSAEAFHLGPILPRWFSVIAGFPFFAAHRKGATIGVSALPA